MSLSRPLRPHSRGRWRTRDGGAAGPADEGAPDQATGASDGLFVNNGAQRPGAATKRAT